MISSSITPTVTAAATMSSVRPLLLSSITWLCGRYSCWLVRVDIPVDMVILDTLHVDKKDRDDQCFIQVNSHFRSRAMRGI
jgi:hypothetical protein